MRYIQVALHRNVSLSKVMFVDYLVHLTSDLPFAGNAEESRSKATQLESPSA